MTPNKLDTSGAFQSVCVQTPKTRLSLPSEAVRVRKSGIEFLSSTPIPPWTEMSVDLHSPRDGRKVRATGVVVDCLGNRHSGYSVSMVFLSLSRQAQAHLARLSGARAA